MATIPSKSAMYELLRAGVLGNTLQMWPTWRDVYRSRYKGFIAIRSHVPGGEFRPNIPADELLWLDVKDYCRCNNCTEQDITLAEMDDPSNRRIISIECGHAGGLPVARWSDQHALFRDAMKSARHVQGASVRSLLRSNLDTCDYEAMDTLMECYPSAMFELTSYERPLGVEHKRMIVWEGRDY